MPLHITSLFSMKLRMNWRCLKVLLILLRLPSQLCSHPQITIRKIRLLHNDLLASNQMRDRLPVSSGSRKPPKQTSVSLA